MTIPLADASRLRELRRLRGEITRMQRRRAEAPLLPLHTALHGLLPDDGLRVGAAYRIEHSPSLLAGLLAPPSQKGLWCAIIGMPSLGVESLAHAGVDLSRVLLVPHPGSGWLTVLSSLSEVVPVLAAHPQGPVRETDAARLNARLRDRGCTLLMTGAWPQSEAVLTLEDPHWRGLHEGWGLLSARTVTVCARSRRNPTPHRVRVQLPGPGGTLMSDDSAPVLLRPASDQAASRSVAG